MSRSWKYFLIGYLLALPHTLIGLILAVIYRCRNFAWNDGCLEATAGVLPGGGTRIWGRPWAQTHGWLIIYDNEEHRARASLRVHERCHVVQAFIGGPLYMIAYGFCFAWIFALLGFKDWKTAYRKNPFEDQAYDREKLPDKWGSAE